MDYLRIRALVFELHGRGLKLPVYQINPTPIRRYNGFIDSFAPDHVKLAQEARSEREAKEKLRKEHKDEEGHPI